MKTVRIIGDIHGKTFDYAVSCLKTEFRHKSEVAPTHSIQVGDFGIGFYSDYWHKELNEWMKDFPNHRFIRGNHDDPAKCKEMLNYIPDGTVEDDVMYIGGAWSIDYDWRTPGVDWWPDEELSYEELNKMIDTYTRVKPRVMITHDCPTTVAWEMFLSKSLGMNGAPQIKARTAEAFQAMFEVHQPEMWFFGHWHHTRKLIMNGTTFQCLGELDFIDVEI